MLGATLYFCAVGHFLSVDEVDTLSLAAAGADEEEPAAHVILPNLPCDASRLFQCAFRAGVLGMLQPDPARRVRAADLATILAALRRAAETVCPVQRLPEVTRDPPRLQALRWAAETSVQTPSQPLLATAPPPPAGYAAGHISPDLPVSPHMSP